MLKIQAWILSKLITWCPFANCLLCHSFSRIAVLRYASFRTYCLFACWLFAWCLFACCLFALCLFACCLFAWCLFACCLSAWCLFLRDTYMIVAFLECLFLFPWSFFYQLWLGIFQIWLNPFLQRGMICFLFPTHLYSPRNDPQPWNDPQIDPEMIPTPKWSPFLFTSTLKWSPINSWNGTCIPSRNYYKSVAAFTFLNRD